MKRRFKCERCHRVRLGRVAKGMCRSCYTTTWVQTHPKAKEWRWAYYSTEGARRKKRSWTLHSRYGITLEEFEKLLDKQGGCCAACSTKHQETNGRAGKLHVDHDHSTGAVRGLLCGPCNNALGHLEGPRLRPLLAYLERAGGGLGD